MAVSNVVLEPGQNLPTHTTPVNVFFYVIAGKGKVQIGNEVTEVNSTDLVLSSPNSSWEDNLIENPIMLRAGNPS